MESDFEKIAAATFIPWERLAGKTILVTGATGLVGYTLVNLLAYANRQKGLDVEILALVRDEERARQRFSSIGTMEEKLRFVVGTVENLPVIGEKIDFIVHGASQTASKTFVEQPVETILTAVNGTQNLLELAREKQVEGFVYLSSMEMYGHPERGHKVTEEEAGAMTPLDVRNSYPISKLQCESLCCAYAKEYGVPAKIARLTQTFGPGVNYNDNRIFAYFGRCVKEKKDIVLKSKGETERCYLYTADAASAILTILLKGGGGHGIQLCRRKHLLLHSRHGREGGKGWRHPCAVRHTRRSGKRLSLHALYVLGHRSPPLLRMASLGCSWGGVIQMYRKMISSV